MTPFVKSSAWFMRVGGELSWALSKKLLATCRKCLALARKMFPLALVRGFARNTSLFAAMFCAFLKTGGVLSKRAAGSIMWTLPAFSQSKRGCLAYGILKTAAFALSAMNAFTPAVANKGIRRT